MAVPLEAPRSQEDPKPKTRLSLVELRADQNPKNTSNDIDEASRIRSLRNYVSHEWKTFWTPKKILLGGFALVMSVGTPVAIIYAASKERVEESNWANGAVDPRRPDMIYHNGPSRDRVRNPRIVPTSSPVPVLAPKSENFPGTLDGSDAFNGNSRSGLGK